MKPELAVIDIGSNSVRLMLAAAENGRVRSLSKRLCTQARQLDIYTYKRTSNAAKDYAQLIKEMERE